MMTSRPTVIAIDGPAASGKSTLGQKLAEALGFLYFDTGVMYRAVTWSALQRQVSPQDEHGTTALAEQLDIDVRPPSSQDGRSYDVLVDGVDVTWDIRRPEVEAHVSVISAYAGVRRALTLQQRRIGARGHVVMVGRDIGTVVFPEAALKIYLDASVEARAHRRFLELVGRGELADLQEIYQSMLRRDHIDSTRDVAPLRPADDAVILSSDNLDAERVLERVKELAVIAGMVS